MDTCKQCVGSVLPPVPLLLLLNRRHCHCSIRPQPSPKQAWPAQLQTHLLIDRRQRGSNVYGLLAVRLPRQLQREHAGRALQEMIDRVARAAACENGGQQLIETWFPEGKPNTFSGPRLITTFHGPLIWSWPE